MTSARPPTPPSVTCELEISHLLDERLEQRRVPAAARAELGVAPRVELLVEGVEPRAHAPRLGREAAAAAAAAAGLLQHDEGVEVAQQLRDRLELLADPAEELGRRALFGGARCYV